MRGPHIRTVRLRPEEGEGGHTGRLAVGRVFAAHTVPPLRPVQANHPTPALCNRVHKAAASRDAARAEREATGPAAGPRAPTRQDSCSSNTTLPAPRAAGHGLSHLSVQLHTRHYWRWRPPSGGWAGPQRPPCPASASWERWASRTVAPHPGSPAGCAAGGGRTLSRRPRANKEAGGQQETASGRQARSSKRAAQESWARSRAFTHLQGVGRRGDVAEQVGEQGLSGGAPLQHSG